LRVGQAQPSLLASRVWGAEGGRAWHRVVHVDSTVLGFKLALHRREHVA
jgi:hypothetical protein